MFDITNREEYKIRSAKLMHALSTYNGNVINIFSAIEAFQLNEITLEMIRHIVIIILEGLIT